MAHRDKVLSLYRQMLRLARSWKSATGITKDTAEERKYILDEARDLFKKNKKITDEYEIKEHIRECEVRFQLALHYGIPYPRPVNIPQNTLAPLSAHLKKGQQKSIEQSKPVYLKSYENT